MSIAFWAKWDALNNWSRIFETSNGPDSNNLVIANEGTSNVFAWEIQEFTSGVTKRRRTKVANAI